MDRLSDELRVAEKQIDHAFKANALTKLNLAQAMWYLLAAFEHRIFLRVHSKDLSNRFQIEPLIDHYLFILRWPVQWLRVSCFAGSFVQTRLNSQYFQAAGELIDLSSEYVDFYKVYTQASRGVLDLRIEGNKLIASASQNTEYRYEAYNRLIKPINAGINEHALFRGLDSIQDKILANLEVRGDRYSFKVHPKTVIFTSETLQTLLEPRFLLPGAWSFTRYSMSDFRQVFSALCALSYLQYAARILAVRVGCESFGILDSLLISTRHGLIARVVRYTGIKREVVRDVIEDLTLGSNGISAEQADPTQQPIIPLTQSDYALTPQLWMNSAAERNFFVLLNKLPREKAIYLSLVQEKEGIMRQRMIDGISGSNWRISYGAVPSQSNLPDIDLALVDPSNRACLFIELKWFLDPAEPRELLEKSEEIKKGISQLLLLKHALEEQNPSILNRVGIESDYSIGFVVVSANWIGYSSDQNTAIPVIHEHHLIKKLQTTDSLREIVDWLNQREYLPEEGVHYELIEIDSQVGNWSIHWYGLQPLIVDDEFLPL